MNTRELQRKQLSEKLLRMSKAINEPRPNKGWIKAIRTALEMTSAQLASRLGVDQSQVIKLEQAEANDAITLKSLRKAANALECELVYAIVPKTSLEENFEKQIDLAAKRLSVEVQHNMQMEKQGLSKKRQKRQLQALTIEMRKMPPKKLWDTERDMQKLSEKRQKRQHESANVIRRKKHD